MIKNKITNYITLNKFDLSERNSTFIGIKNVDKANKKWVLQIKTHLN